MALQVKDRPDNLPTIGIAPVQKQPSIKVAPLPAQPKVTVATPIPQPKLSVQPLPQQPTIAVPARPPEPKNMAKVAGDINVARTRTTDDDLILSTLAQKTPELAPNIEEARKRGANATQILNYIQQKYKPATTTETQPKQKGFFDDLLQAPIGVAKSFAQTGQTLARPLDAIVEKITGSKPLIPASLSDEELESKNTLQSIGKVGGDIAQFVMGAEATKPLVIGFEKAVQSSKLLPELSKKLVSTFGRATVGAGEGFGLSKVMGKSNEEAEQNALFGFAAPFVGAGIQASKGFLGKTGEKIQEALIKPTLADTKAGFNVKNLVKYDVGGNLEQIVTKSGDKIKSLVRELKSKIVPGTADIDLNQVVNQVENKLGKATFENAGMNKALKNAIADLKEEVALMSPNGVVDIADGQLVKQGFGAKGAWQYGKPAEDAKALEQVYNEAYLILKEAIENKGLPGINQLNKQLSELIPIQHAVIRRIPVANRANAFSLGDLVALSKTPGGVGLFILNRLSKSGRVGNFLQKTAKEVETRSGVGTLLSGSGTKDLEKATSTPTGFITRTKRPR